MLKFNEIFIPFKKKLFTELFTHAFQFNYAAFSAADLITGSLLKCSLASNTLIYR